ncbi:uncharacterized protein LOC142984884 [Anticarsia gemmatalis]|uniref:uncharacterized protein LOC142984884 n=1 Tax=Anticarsia gemmatalis TaxID=129554 RepID=UPI003F76A7DB
MKVLYLLVLLLAACAYVQASPAEVDELAFAGPVDDIIIGEPDWNAKPPPYKEAKALVDRAAIEIQNHLFPLSNNIVNLQSYKRHYAIAFNVLLSQAQGRTDCQAPPYETNYQVNLNTSAVEGLCNPQKVVDNAKALLDGFNMQTDKIQELIRKHCRPDPLNCNSVVDSQVNAAEPSIKDEVSKLFVGAKSAGSFLQRNREFLHESHKLRSLSYVISGVHKLKHAVLTLHDLLKALDIGDGEC